MNAATTVKESQRQASTRWQCNRERARRTSCAQAGTACTVFSLWLATNATPAKQKWHGRRALSRTVHAAACMLLHARLSVEGLVSSPANMQEQRCSGQGTTAPKLQPTWQWRRSRVDDRLSVCGTDERTTSVTHTRRAGALPAQRQTRAQITDDWRRLDDVPIYGDDWTDGRKLTELWLWTEPKHFGLVSI